MRIMKAVLIVLATISVNYSLDLSISGKVTDTGTTPLTGALVKLERNGLSATTGIDGGFALTNVVIVNDNKLMTHDALSARIENGILFLNIQKKVSLEITTYTLHGKVVSSIKKEAAKGTQRIILHHTGDGMYLHTIKYGSNKLLLKCFFTDSKTYSIILVSKNMVPNEKLSNTKLYAPFDDVIAVSMEGYLNYRVIVTNSDTSGIEIKMITCADTVRDINGNLYQAVQLGNQMWTTENLRTTRYNDSSAIPHVPDSAQWNNRTEPAYCYYDNATDSDTIRKYGALYNWHTVNTGKLAPAGWHVPSRVEWDTLVNYLIANGYNFDGSTMDNKVAKSLAAQEGWKLGWDTGAPGYNQQINNRSGFSAIPVGCRSSSGLFGQKTYEVIFWSATETPPYYTSAWNYRVFFDYNHFSMNDYRKSFGFSVRLVKNATVP